MIPLMFGILAVTVAACRPLGCASLRTGDYFTVEPEAKRTQIHRGAEFQVENFNNGERITELRVTWVSDCEYNLTYHRTIAGPDIIPQVMKEGVLNVRIVEITDSSYITRTKLVNLGPEIRQEIMFSR